MPDFLKESLGRKKIDTTALSKGFDSAARAVMIAARQH
jgi:hypothetical protein